MCFFNLHAKDTLITIGKPQKQLLIKVIFFFEDI